MIVDRSRRLQSVYVPMGDGVRLAVDVWFPAERTAVGGTVGTVMRVTRYHRAEAPQEPGPEFDRTEGVLGQRRHPGDPDGRAAVVPAATPRDSGPMRLNLPVSSPVLPVCHDDAGWCVGSSTLEHSPASLVLA